MSILSFYRRDEPRVRGILVRGGVALTVGAFLLLVCALTERLHLSPMVRWSLSALGIFLFGYALITGFLQLPTLLRYEVYVAIRTDGLFLSLEPDPEILVPWEDLESVDAEGDEIVMRRRAGEPLRLSGRFGGKTTAELAQCLDDARRKSSLNLLA